MAFMSNFNRIILLVLLAGCNATNAGTMGSESMPKEHAFSFGALALYMQPSFGGNGLGYSSFSNYGIDVFGNTVNSNGGADNIFNVVPTWGWGFQLEGAYHFTNNDITVNWYHLNEKVNGHLPQGTLFAGSASALYAGQLTLAPRWNAVNLEFGQFFHLDTCKMVRVHAGMEFAKVQNIFTNYPQLYPVGSPLFVTTDLISYQGFGPRVGGDFSYGLLRETRIYANVAGGLLVGTAKQNVSGYTNYTTNQIGTQYYSTGNYVHTHQGIVIPELEAKLGLKYNIHTIRGNLGFDIGYLWLSYLNSLVAQVGAGVESSAISTGVTTNFTMQGLYFGMKWTGTP